MGNADEFVWTGGFEVLDGRKRGQRLVMTSTTTTRRRMRGRMSRRMGGRTDARMGGHDGRIGDVQWRAIGW